MPHIIFSQEFASEIFLSVNLSVILINLMKKRGMQDVAQFYESITYVFDVLCGKCADGD